MIILQRQFSKSLFYFLFFLMKFSFPVILWLSLLFTSCVAPKTETPSPIVSEKLPEVVQQEAPRETTATNTQSYTATEVSTHATKDDCWLILDGGVYDVTSFIPRHPGGDKILRWCGKDATQMFAKHPDSAKAMKEQFKIGELTQ